MWSLRMSNSSDATDGVHQVLHLPERVPDPLARSRVEDRLQARTRLRVARREHRDLVPGVDEAVGEQRDDALDPAVRLGRNREPDGTDHADSHSARSESARADSGRAKIPEGVRFAAAAHAPMSVIYTPSAIVTRPRSTETDQLRPKARTPSTRRPSSQLGSSSVTFVTSRWRTRSGSIPSSTRTSRIGVPAAQAWGRAAVGYAIGNGVSSRA